MTILIPGTSKRVPSVCLDTNILLDALLNRSPFDVPAWALLIAVENKEYTGYCTILSLVHVHYQIKKSEKKTEAQIRQILDDLLLIIKPLSVPKEISVLALNNQTITDFEDAVLYEQCLWHKIDFLVTRNLKDFPTAAHQLFVCDANMLLNRTDTIT